VQAADHSIRRATRVLAVVVAIVAFVVALAVPALAAKRKNYSASISGTTAFGGNTVTFTITIANQASSFQSLGSANVTIPSGFTFVSFGAQIPPPGKTWLPPTLAGSVIQLRNPGPSNTNALSPGQQLTVGVTVIAPCPPATSYTWLTRAKQSNDFSGFGNDFARIGPDPSVTVTVGCPDHVAFGQQPTGTIAGQPINAKLFPSGVTVRIEDAIGQLVTNSTAAVSMSIGSGPGSLFGTSPVNAVGGIATYTDLAIDSAGTYTLLGESAPLAAGTSADFEVTGVSGKCDQTPCGAATGGHATADDVTVGAVSVPVGPCVGVCFVSLDEGTGDFCEGPCTGNTIIFAPPPNQDEVATLTIEMYKTLFSGNLGGVRVFKLADDGATVTELFDCPPTDPAAGAPCVSDREHVPGGNALFAILLGFGDPGMGTR
jgi:hypothetical protein